MSSTEITDLGVIPLPDLWLQDLIWNHLHPVCYFQDFGHNKTDMMKHLESAWSSGYVWFLGSKQGGFVFRVAQCSPQVIDIHLLGNTKRLRTLMPLGLTHVFTKTNIEKINVHTPYVAAAHISLRMGFQYEGCMRMAGMDTKGNLQDMYILGMTRNDYLTYQQRRKKHNHGQQEE